MDERAGARRENRYGKLFFTVAALLVACMVTLPLLSALAFSQELERAGGQIGSSIEALMSDGIGRHKDMRVDSAYLAELAIALDEDDLVSRMGQGEVQAGDREELSARLEDAFQSIARTKSGTYDIAVCFSSGEGLVQAPSSDPAHVPVYVVEGVADMGLSQGEGLARYHLGDDKSITLVYAVTDQAFLLMTKVGPDPVGAIVEELRRVSPHCEIAYYDSFATVHAFSEERELVDAFSYGDFPAVSGVASLSFEQGGRPYVCYYVAYDDTKTVMAVFAEDTAEGTRRDARLLIAVVLSIAVASFVCALLYFTRTVYRPVRRMASRVSEGRGGVVPFDEIGALERGIDQMETRSDSQRALLREASLLCLLQGRDPLSPEEDLAGFPFEGAGACAVVGVRLDPVSELEESDEPLERAALVKGLVDALAARGFGSAAEVDDGFLRILVVPLGAMASDGGDRAVRAVVASCEDAASLASRRARLSLSCFVSEAVGCGPEVETGYDQVNRLARHCLMTERYGAVLRFADVEAHLGGPSVIDAARMQAFADAVQEPSKERALACFDSIVAGFADASAGALEKDAPGLIVLESLMRLGVSRCPAARIAHVSGDEALNRGIEAAASVADVRDVLEAVLEKLEEAGNRETSDKARFASVEEFVREHASDPNLSGQMVANRFGMSQSNVTRMFKKFTGKGFLAYLHEWRVERAREVLETTDRPLEEVAALTGFGNALTMSRAFKKVVGTTPGAYRDAANR